MHRIVRSILAFAAVLAIASCASKPEWQLDDVEGHLPDLKFNMTSDQDAPVTEKDYTGKIVLLYFGYTHCPDVCPLTLAHLHVVLQRLGAKADDVRVLFVSVDPARDTPGTLHTYVSAFDPHVTGLTGTKDEIAKLAKRYRAAFNSEKPNADGSYEVSHSSGIYVFGRDGKARLLATSATPVDAIVHDLGILIGADS